MKCGNCRGTPAKPDDRQKLTPVVVNCFREPRRPARAPILPRTAAEAREARSAEHDAQSEAQYCERLANPEDDFAGKGAIVLVLQAVAVLLCSLRLTCSMDGQSR